MKRQRSITIMSSLYEYSLSSYLRIFMIIILFILHDYYTTNNNDYTIIPSVMSLMDYDSNNNNMIERKKFNIPSIEDIEIYIIQENEKRKKQQKQLEQEADENDNDEENEEEDSEAEGGGEEDIDEEEDDEDSNVDQMKNIVNSLDPIDMKFFYSRTYQTLKKDIDIYNKEYCYDTRDSCHILAYNKQCNNHTFDTIKYNTTVSSWMSSHCKLSCQLCHTIAITHLISYQFNKIHYHEYKHPTIETLQTINKQ